MVGAIIGRVLLGILIFFVLLALCPVTLSVRLEHGEPLAWVRILFVKLQIWPMPEGHAKETKPKKRRKKQEAEKEEKPKKARKPRTLDYWLRFIERLAFSAKKALRVVMKGIRVRGVELVVPVEGDEAADVALNYGKLQASVASARGALENLVNIRFKRMVLVPDFTGEHKDELFFTMRATAPVFIYFAAGVLGLWKFFTFKRPFWKRTTPLHTFGNESG